MLTKLLKSCFIFFAFFFSHQVLHAANLVLTTAVANYVSVNGNLTYSFLVENNGPDAGINVRLSGSLPYSASFVSFDGPAGWTAPTPTPGVSSASFVATIASLAPGAKHLLTLVVNVTGMSAGTILNGIFVVSDGTSSYQAIVYPTILASPVILNVKEAIAQPSAPLPADHDIIYLIQLTNMGNKPLSGVSFTNTLLPGLSFVSLSSVDGWETTTPPVGSSGLVTASTPTLLPGQTSVFLLTARPGAVFVGTTMRNETIVKSTNPNISSSDNVSVEIGLPYPVPVELNARKTGPAKVTTGKEATYTISVINFGNSASAQVTLVDSLQSGSTFVSMQPLRGWAINSPQVGQTGIITASIPPLPSGYIITCDVVVKVADTLSANALSNSVYLTSSSPQLYLGNDTAVSTAMVMKDTSALHKTAGLNYKYYEGNFDKLPDYNLLTPIKTGVSANTDLSVRPTGVNDHFAFVWDGTIKVPSAGDYTFETISDDGSKLFLNGSLLVNNDGVHASVSASGKITIPAAGSYPFAVSFFENTGDQSLQVYWSGPGFARQLIPDSVFSHESIGSVPKNAGLNYKYYEGIFDKLPDFTTLIPVKTGTSANVDISVRPSGINDHFAFVWEGTIHIPQAGDYTFETISDDGSKLYFNGNTLVNNDGLHPDVSASGKITIPTAGNYPISISFFENSGDQDIQVYWSGPGFARQLIPDSVFNHESINSLPQHAGLNYKYYEGDFDKLPDFTTLTPVKTGISANADISVRPTGVNDHFAFLWEGTIHIPAAGDYTFETISDDASRLYFNGNLLVDNDGVHASISASGKITIPAAGNYSIDIGFFEKTGDQNMQLYWTGPGFTRQLIPDAAFNTLMPASNVAPTESKSADISQTTNKLPEVPVVGKIYPNPFSQTFTIEYFNTTNDTHKIDMGLYDLNGKLLYDFKPAALAPGYNRWPVSLSNTRLSAGIYFVKLNIDGLPAVITKVVKLN